MLETARERKDRLASEIDFESTLAKNRSMAALIAEIEQLAAPDEFYAKSIDAIRAAIAKWREGKS